MYTFHELEKNCKLDMKDFAKYRLAVLGNCATQHLSKAIRGYGYTKEMNLEVFDADYNQIEFQLVDPNSETYAFGPNMVLLMMCTEKLYEKYCQTPQNTREAFAEKMADTIEGYWKLIMGNCDALIMQSNFTVVDDAVFGSYANLVAGSFLYQVRKLNYLLMEKAAGCKKVHILDTDLLQQRFGLETVHDDRTYFVGKLPFAVKMLPYVAKMVVDQILAIKGKVRKCVVLDLDNTLWGGVIGDDGLENIQIGELGQGQAFSRLQSWLLELRKRGILLAVCSKNEEDAARLPFEKHPEMILKLDDIAMFVANWEDKASNIRRIQETLNIGMDSLVFLDDNPFERQLVQSMIPEICVPDLPEDPSEYLPYLKSLNLFETASFSSEDAGRTKQYQEEAARTSLQQQFASYEEYLKSLSMKAQCKPFDSFHYPRIAQLSQRSNQFNVRTIRYTEADVEALANDPEAITIYVTLEDKFGDYGLISVIVLKKKTEDTLFVEEWLMSCRVLRRGVEELVADTIVKRAMEAGYRYVEGEYLATAKNKMVQDLFSRMGFDTMDENHYLADIKTYQMHSYEIAVEE